MSSQVYTYWSLGLVNKIDNCNKFFLLVIPMDPITKLGSLNTTMNVTLL